MALTLYEIGNELEAVLARADENGGELSTEDKAILDALEMEEGEKLERCGHAYLNLVAEAKSFKEEAARLAERKAVLENKAESLKQYVFGYLKHNKMDGMEHGTIRLKLCKTPPSVAVLDDKLIPKKYFEPQPDKLMKSLIQQDIKAGKKVPGAVMQQGTYLKIS